MTIHAPNLVETMKVDTEDNVIDLNEDTTVARKRIKRWATLTPTLFQAVKGTNLKPTAVFLAVVIAIKGQMTPDPENIDETEEEMLVMVGTPYLPTLKSICTVLTTKSRLD